MIAGKEGRVAEDWLFRCARAWKVSRLLYESACWTNWLLLIPADQGVRNPNAQHNTPRGTRAGYVPYDHPRAAEPTLTDRCMRRLRGGTRPRTMPSRGPVHGLAGKDAPRQAGGAAHVESCCGTHPTFFNPTGRVSSTHTHHEPARPRRRLPCHRTNAGRRLAPAWNARRPQGVLRSRSSHHATVRSTVKPASALLLLRSCPEPVS